VLQGGSRHEKSPANFDRRQLPALDCVIGSVSGNPEDFCGFLYLEGLAFCVHLGPSEKRLLTVIHFGIILYEISQPISRSAGVPMAGKSKSVDRDAVLTFRLPRELYERVKKAAGDRSVSEEMRRRLEASFDVSRDPTTMKLTSAIRLVAQFLEAVYPAWHQDPFVFLIFKMAIDALLQEFKPEGEPKPLPELSSDPKPSGLLLAGLALGALEKI
jgi:hypothetical protein